jgi:hypothetical protein
MMMKKILVLVLVLGLVPVANAALSISVNGGPPPAEITLKPSDTLVLNIHGDDPADGGPAEAYYLVEGPGSISGGDMVYGGGLAAYLNCEDLAGALGMADCDAVIASFRDFLSKPDLMDVSYALLADNDVPPDNFLDGTLVDGIEFHCDGEGWVTVSLVGADFSVIDSIRIEQIPEPMTFALLGLGGLFLRRRK